MTKWIVGLLLLANLAIFGWMRWGSTLTVDADTVMAQAALNQDKIKLLEMLPASAASSGSTPASAPAITLPPAPLPTPAAVPSSAPGATPTLPPVPAAAAPSAPSTVPVVKAKKILPKLSNCAEWGEFSGGDLVRAQQALALLKLGDDLSQRIVEHKHGYWVYVPPMKKRAEVEKRIAQLKERGVKDYFVVQEEGKWLNAISLGVFKTKEAAQKYLAVLRAKEVRTAKVGERISKLKFTVFVMKELDSGAADKLSALQKEFPDSELKVSACAN